MNIPEIGRRWFIGMLTMVTGVILFASLSPGARNTLRAASSGAPVLVTNTTAQPVPTASQGTTAISGNVGITGTPNINIANTPTIALMPSATSRAALLIVIPTRDGQSYFLNGGSEFWRTFVFVEGVETFEAVQSPEQALQAGRAFGEFQRRLG